MTETPEFLRYLEALTVLATVDDRQREALRKAVEGAAADEDRARARISEQQRMYDRASRDIEAAERAIQELRTICGLRPAQIPFDAADVGSAAPPLAEIRTAIAEVADWAAQSRPLLESLLRTRERLLTAQQRVAAVPSAPAHTPPPRSHPRRRGWAWTVALVAIVVVVVVVVISTQ